MDLSRIIISQIHTKLRRLRSMPGRTNTTILQGKHPTLKQMEGLLIFALTYNKILAHLAVTLCKTNFMGKIHLPTLVVITCLKKHIWQDQIWQFTKIKSYSFQFLLIISVCLSRNSIPYYVNVCLKIVT